MQPMTCIQPAVETSEVKQLDSVGACDLPDGAAYTILRACFGMAWGGSSHGGTPGTGGRTHMRSARLMEQMVMHGENQLTQASSSQL